MEVQVMYEPDVVNICEMLKVPEVPAEVEEQYHQFRTLIKGKDGGLFTAKDLAFIIMQSGYAAPEKVPQETKIASGAYDDCTLEVLKQAVRSRGIDMDMRGNEQTFIDALTAADKAAEENEGL